MTIDTDALLRRVKPDKRIGLLAPRPRQDLVGVADLIGAGRPKLLLDTNVYIHQARGTLSVEARSVLGQATVSHCAVCLAELMIGLGNADPAHPDWPRKQDHYQELMRTVPASRLLTPDASVWMEAGLIAGTLARTQRFQPHQRKEALNDTLIYLTAAKAGMAVLTANRDEFDFIQQLARRGAFVHY